MHQVGFSLHNYIEVHGQQDVKLSNKKYRKQVKQGLLYY